MKIVKNFILRNIAGESVLVPTGETSREFNGLMSMSETGTLIWNMLKEEKKLNEIVSTITDEYEIDEEIALRDTVEFINKLISVGIVEV